MPNTATAERTAPADTPEVAALIAQYPEVAELLPVAKTKCNPCNGTGTVLVDPNDRRKGETTCLRCGGTGEL